MQLTDGGSKSVRDMNNCPYCGELENNQWATELGYNVVRCSKCSLLFVSPLPISEHIDEAVRTGLHRNLSLNVTSRRIPSKRRWYASHFRRMFSDLLDSQSPLTWVDIGCGYGEVLEAVLEIVPRQSRVLGFEPMQPKAFAARTLGLEVINDYLTPDIIKADVVSVVDIFSHIPDFHSFLKVVTSNLTENGLLYIETGNLADLDTREQFPGELGLPDHLVFAGEATLRGYLQEAGFEIEATEYQRTDTLLDFSKNIVKRILGRPVRLSLPYTSKYRQIRIRARLKPNSQRCVR
jgi:SAM-dependent methyltransferase